MDVSTLPVIQSRSNLPESLLIKYEAIVSRKFNNYLIKGRRPSDATLERNLKKFNTVLEKSGLNQISMKTLNQIYNGILSRPRLLGGAKKKPTAEVKASVEADLDEDEENILGFPETMTEKKVSEAKAPISGPKKKLKTSVKQAMGTRKGLILDSNKHAGVDQDTLLAFAGLIFKGGLQAAYEALEAYVTDPNFSNLHLFTCIRFAFEPGKLITTGTSRKGTTMPYKHDARTKEIYDSKFGESKAHEIGQPIIFSEKLAALMPHLSADNIEAAKSNDVEVKKKESTQGALFKRRMKEQGAFGSVNKQMTRRLAHLTLYLMDKGEIKSGFIYKRTKEERRAVEGFSKQAKKLEVAEMKYFAKEKPATKQINREFIHSFLDEEAYWSQNIKDAIKTVCADDTLTSIKRARETGIYNIAASKGSK
jgi:hypothetical protein